jgi:hypothetical protein
MRKIALRRIALVLLTISIAVGVVNAKLWINNFILSSQYIEPTYITEQSKKELLSNIGNQAIVVGLVWCLFGAYLFFRFKIRDTRPPSTQRRALGQNETKARSGGARISILRVGLVVSVLSMMIGMVNAKVWLNIHSQALRVVETGKTRNVEESMRLPKTGYYEVQLPDGSIDYVPDNLSPSEAGQFLRERNPSIAQGLGKAMLNSAAQGLTTDTAAGVLRISSLLQVMQFADEPQMRSIEIRFQEMSALGQTDLINSERHWLKMLMGEDIARRQLVDAFADNAIGGQGNSVFGRFKDTPAYNAAGNVDEWGQDTFPVMPEHIGRLTRISFVAGQVAPIYSIGVALNYSGRLTEPNDYLSLRSHAKIELQKISGRHIVIVGLIWGLCWVMIQFNSSKRG